MNNNSRDIGTIINYYYYYLSISIGLIYTAPTNETHKSSHNAPSDISISNDG